MCKKSVKIILGWFRNVMSYRKKFFFGKTDFCRWMELITLKITWEVGIHGALLKIWCLDRVYFKLIKFCMIWNQAIFTMITVLNFLITSCVQTSNKQKYYKGKKTIVFHPYNLFVFKCLTTRANKKVQYGQWTSW